MRSYEYLSMSITISTPSHINMLDVEGIICKTILECHFFVFT